MIAEALAKHDLTHRICAWTINALLFLAEMVSAWEERITGVPRCAVTQRRRW